MRLTDKVVSLKIKNSHTVLSLIAFTLTRVIVRNKQDVFYYADS